MRSWLYSGPPPAKNSIGQQMGLCNGYFPLSRDYYGKQDKMSEYEKDI